MCIIADGYDAMALFGSHAGTPLVKDLREFLRRNHFQLGEGAAAGAPVGPPSMEVSNVAKAPRLHVLVSNFDNELGADGFPG